MAGFTGPSTRTEDLGLSKLNALDSALGQPISVSSPSFPTPGQPQLTLVGPPGQTSYAYAMVANHPNAAVSDSVPSLSSVVFNGPAVLTATNFITIQWNPVPGATTYKILRYLPATNTYQTLSNALALANTVLSYNDNGVGTLAAYIAVVTPPIFPTQDLSTTAAQVMQPSQAGNTAIGSTVRNVLTGLGGWRNAFMNLVLSVQGTGAGSTTIYIQGSSDSGTTWSDLAAFPAITNAMTTTQRAQLQLSDTTPVATPQIQTTSDQSTAPTLAAGTVRGGPFSDRLRIVEVVTAVWTVAPTYTITAQFSS
jgi:hypothetical protein